jgi:hypothetical protein
MHSGASPTSPNPLDLAPNLLEALAQRGGGRLLLTLFPFQGFPFRALLVGGALHVVINLSEGRGGCSCK